RTIHQRQTGSDARPADSGISKGPGDAHHLMRLDKWLWAARFFKTRSLAQQAVAGGRVQLNGDRTKPAHEVKLGDMVLVRVGDWRWEVKVKGLSDRRGPAEEARKLYDETAESRAERERV